MAKEKKKSYRKEYLNDFRPDDTGKYSYQGEMKSFSEAESAARKKADTAGASALFFILAAGFVTGRDIGGKAYVLIPYLIAIGALGFAVYSAFTLGRKTEVRSYIAKRAVPRMRGGAAVTMAACALAALGGLVTIVISPGTELILKIGFTLLMTGAALDAYLMKKEAEKLKIS